MKYKNDFTDSQLMENVRGQIRECYIRIREQRDIVVDLKHEEIKMRIAPFEFGNVIAFKDHMGKQRVGKLGMNNTSPENPSVDIYYLVKSGDRVSRKPQYFSVDHLVHAKVIAKDEQEFTDRYPDGYKSGSR